MELARYSMGVGDRFGRQGTAQLRALADAARDGLAVAPVWNKSEREHGIIGTTPDSVRREADDAVKALGWTAPYFVDADHINSALVHKYLEAADFFTLDVADFIGGAVDEAEVSAFVDRHGDTASILEAAGLAEGAAVTRETMAAAARMYLPAVAEAARTYRCIADARGADGCVVEVSMDETDRPQSPVELYIIMAAIADADIPARTLAPKFSGRFNKGVDYVGDVSAFAAEFDADIRAVACAVARFDLPRDLKLSVHSGSDKYAIYPAIQAAVSRHGCGLHLKTAGTTWLEEVAGLALAGGEALDAVKHIYAEALARREALCAPYASVIDIRPERLPPTSEVADWSGEAFAEALRHDQNCPGYNPDVRQLLHVGYKVAAEMGARYLALLDEHRDGVGRLVTANIARHVRAVFPGVA